MPPRVNAKAQAGRERKAEQKAKKEAEAARKQEELEAKEWRKGANTRGAARAEAKASKADEAARKRREKAELLAAEEAETSGGTSKPRKSPRSKKKKKDDLSLLEDALVSAADKKQKAKKREERLKKEQEQAKAKAATKETEPNMDPLLANTTSMIGLTTTDETAVGREANKAIAGTGESGIDAALESLTVQETPDALPEKRVKALHRAFEEKMMPIVKNEYPGLRLTQYKEKIFQLWKKSPENPLNNNKPPSNSP